MGTGILGAALVGGVGGFGQGIAEVDQQKMKEKSKLREMYAAEQIREQMRVEAEKRADERIKSRNLEVENKAGEYAKERGTGLLRGAMSAYESIADTDPEGAKLGIDAARKADSEGLYAQEVTREDRLRAMRETGQLDPIKGLDLERQQSQDEKKAERDEKADEREDRSLDIQERNARNSAAMNAIQYKVAKLAYERAELEAKIPPAVAKKYGTLESEYKGITTALNKAMAEGTYDAATAAPLLARQQELTESMNSLLDDYLPKGSVSGKEEPPYPGARKARDGKWYVQKDGKTYLVNTK